ncbi:MAG: hypothetical protein ACOYW4_10845, partial [Bacillota bacterium]
LGVMTSRPPIYGVLHLHYLASFQRTDDSKDDLQRKPCIGRSSYFGALALLNALDEVFQLRFVGILLSR